MMSESVELGDEVEMTLPLLMGVPSYRGTGHVIGVEGHYALVEFTDVPEHAAVGPRAWKPLAALTVTRKAARTVVKPARRLLREVAAPPVRHKQSTGRREGGQAHDSRRSYPYFLVHESRFY